MSEKDTDSRHAFEQMEEVEDRGTVNEHDVVGVCQHEDCDAKIRAHIHRKKEGKAFITIVCPKCKRDPGVIEKLKG